VISAKAETRAWFVSSAIELIGSLFTAREKNTSSGTRVRSGNYRMPTVPATRWRAGATALHTHGAQPRSSKATWSTCARRLVARSHRHPWISMRKCVRCRRSRRASLTYDAFSDPYAVRCGFLPIAVRSAFIARLDRYESSNEESQQGSGFCCWRVSRSRALFCAAAEDYLWALTPISAR